MLVESGKQAVEDLLTADLALSGRILALALEGWAELQGGDEERAGLADRFKMAVHLNRPGAVAVPQHPAVHLAPELAHLGAFIASRQFAWFVVEGLNLLGDGEVLVSHGLIGDTRVNHRHSQRLMAEHAAMASRLIPRLMACVASVCRN